MKFGPHFLMLTLNLILFAQTAQAGWGVSVYEDEKKERAVKIGGRLQGELRGLEGKHDMYLRRTRVNIEYKLSKEQKVYFDLRNDKANNKDKGEMYFAIGDAFWEYAFDDESIIKNVKLFRGKVDVSYSQTTSSKHLFSPERVAPSERASNFVSESRRATNAQINGNLGNTAFHVVVGDGINSGDIDPLMNGKTDLEVTKQNLTYGAKLRHYFMGDARKNKAQDTFYGDARTFSVGVGYFRNDRIEVDPDGASKFSFDRSLLNIELSFAYDSFRLLGEYFAFDGDVIDPNNAVTGEAEGGYIQAEYLIGKIAPNLGFESLDRWRDQAGYRQHAYFVGVNHYVNKESMRYGATLKRTNKDSNLGTDLTELYAHVMMNF